MPYLLYYIYIKEFKSLKNIFSCGDLHPNKLPREFSLKLKTCFQRQIFI